MVHLVGAYLQNGGDSAFTSLRDHFSYSYINASGIRFHKRHLALVDEIYFGLIAIEKNDIESTIGEDDAQGQAHMAAPAIMTIFLSSA